MADGLITVELTRDGQNTPWGFRLQGGKDVGFPLTVQRVFLGSPSESELHRGDIIVMIGNKESKHLTHQDASEIFRKAGNKIRLVVHRRRHSASSGTSSPIGNPLAHLSGGPVTMYHFAAPSSSTGSTPPPPLTKPGDYVFRPLPTTQFHNNYRPFSPDPQSLTDDEQREYVFEKHRERQSIVHQAHRTFPLITPQAKPRHDMPTGSYLRFVNDPNWKINQPDKAMANKVSETLLLSKLQDSVRSPNSSVSSYSPGRTPTPESAWGGGPKIVHKQYNSPVSLYSAEAVTEALVGQTSIEHSRHTPSKANQPLPSPLIYTPSELKRSATYQMIHNQEWEDLKKTELREHNPVQNKEYTVPPFGEGRFGQGSDVIQQSGSFKNLMTNMTQSAV